MTHQTEACKPQKTKMAVNSSSVLPRLHSWTLFYPFERRSRRYSAPHERLRAKCRHIVLKIHEKNDRARGGSGPSVYTPLTMPMIGAPVAKIVWCHDIHRGILT